MPPPSRPPLDPAALVAPGWRVEVVPESPSTNADVALRARAGEAPGLVVVTEHQTAGRGRLDRVWVTPPRAALTFSLLVRPEAVPVARWPWLPLLTGLAVVEGVRRSSPLDAVLKWPNDVLVEERKVAGILVERVEAPDGAAAVVGVGLNVSSTPDELPVPTATSLELAGAPPVDRSALLVAVLTAFSDLYGGWVGAAGQGLRPSYTRSCSTIGRDVRVDLPGGAPLHGRALDVDEDGRLLVDDGSRVHALGAGDVVHVRPV
ncbi:biotin--[acetyl-CoA-carboxylase] ligase [Nocardioides panacis]|uniref:biotin--[biotin carboxyl-carrier protein] ligase n=1 Tax=Nocardioides panacis TaxID=2849501 RepID=A0A975Y2K7_9ACTN|nr:biotin--[acetyl-CoA-carboxylase] ligase [Nocardioides panacis]